jgi:hypothetical protein
MSSQPRDRRFHVEVASYWYRRTVQQLLGTPEWRRDIVDRGYRARRMLREPASGFCVTLDRAIMFQQLNHRPVASDDRCAVPICFSTIHCMDTDAPRDYLWRTLAVIRANLDTLRKAGWQISSIRHKDALARTVSFTAVSPSGESTLVVCADNELPGKLQAL